MSHTDLDHLNMTVNNLEESAEWYSRLFGFEWVEGERQAEEPWGILRSGNSMLCLYEAHGLKNPRDETVTEAAHHIAHFGLRIRDRRAWEEAVAREDIRTYYGSPVRYPRSWSWYVKDPTGYMIEVALWDDNRVEF